jgi:hypothetical protein
MMMMFYFDLQTDGAVSKDTEGTDLPDLDAPVDEILITDGQGGVLATISLADMIPRKLRR